MKRRSEFPHYPTVTPFNQSESPELQFARQLYDSCLEGRGPDHEQTRLVRDHMVALESRDLAKVGEVVCPLHSNG